MIELCPLYDDDDNDRDDGDDDDEVMTPQSLILRDESGDSTSTNEDNYS